MRPLKLLGKTLLAKINEGSDDVILFEENSSIKTFQLRCATLIMAEEVGETIYKMPKDTVSILQTNTRKKDGTIETSVLRRRLNEIKSVAVPMSKKMLELLTQLERQVGYPLKVVFAKRKNGNLSLVHREKLELPLAAQLNVYKELLGFVSRKDRLKILRKLPLDLGNLQTHFFTKPPKKAIKGIAAYPGILVVQKGEWFAAETTSPADVAAMHTVKVIFTGGGLLSHAALLASSEGIPCIVGLSSTNIEIINSSDGPISVDAYAGKVYLQPLEIEVQHANLHEHAAQVFEYAREFAEMDVYANADSADAIQSALRAGASGIGLYRTEHMWQEHTNLLSAYLAAALANDLHKRREVLSTALQVARGLLTSAFEALGPAYIAIRLLDAPLNEFGANYTENNPMMGLRGCRFGILFSDFYAMQVQAIAEAYRAKGSAEVGIMVPLVSEVGEVIVLHDLIRRVWRACRMPEEILKFGVMIETPRACLISGEIAPYCDFLSYGTNDLTQFTFAFSRDDAGFLPNYVQLGVLEHNPFESLDARGVGRLIYLSAKMARAGNPDVILGLCGNHAGDPASVQLVQSFGFDYVSCTKANIAKAILSTVHERCGSH